jgi:putrescine transport system ATP-binding protein
MTPTGGATSGSAGTKASADQAFLRLDKLVQEFGSGGGQAHRAVDQISLDIAKGEIFALLGPSGCGKTTLLRMLGGFDQPTSGSISLGGRNLNGLAPYERPINMMFQSYALFPHLSVWDNIAFGLRREGLPKAQVAERVEAMLKLVQLGKFAQRKPHQMSGGQQQRVALARSLAKQPQLLLLDEPLGALDKKLREETQIELVNIIEGVGVTCVMVTHDQEEAMAMATRIGIMRDGRLQQVGTPREIYETPTSRFVADFIGNVNLLDGTLAVDEPDHVEIQCADVRHFVGHGITGHEGMAVAVALRPEKIRISRRPPPADDTDLVPDAQGRPLNQVKGVIKNMIYLGSDTIYHLQLPSGALLKVSQGHTERHPDDALSWDDEAYAWWSPSAHVVLTQ